MPGHSEVSTWLSGILQGNGCDEILVNARNVLQGYQLTPDHSLMAPMQRES